MGTQFVTSVGSHCPGDRTLRSRRNQSLLRNHPERNEPRKTPEPRDGTTGSHRAGTVRIGTTAQNSVTSETGRTHRVTDSVATGVPRADTGEVGTRRATVTGEDWTPRTTAIHTVTGTAIPAARPAIDCRAAPGQQTGDRPGSISKANR